MKIATQVFAFTGMMVAGAAMLSTAHAASFGQQWRPASTGYATTHNSTYGNGFRRVANVPSFRPRTSASSPRYVARSSYRPAAAYPRPIRPHQAAYPQVTHMPRPQGLTYPGMSPWSAMPAWANPFAHMSRAWQYQMPVYPRQFAWQPGERARLSQNRRSPERYRHYASYDVASSPRVAYRPVTRTGFAAAPAWRPTGGVGATYRGNTARTPATYRPPVVAAMPRTAVTLARPEPSSAAVWRPRAATLAAVHVADRTFRPAAYGRSAPTLGGSASPRVAAERLPGWVTTYQDEVGDRACDWCSGS